jgi:hypothetical protein
MGLMVLSASSFAQMTCPANSRPASKDTRGSFVGAYGWGPVYCVSNTGFYVNLGPDNFMGCPASSNIVCRVPAGYATFIPPDGNYNQGALRNGATFINMGPTTWGNIALGKPTQQSSTYSNPNNFTSGQAVDGNPNTITNTNNGANEWWMVDFQGTYQINNITIYNRPDCCGERLVGATVEVLNSGGNVIWSDMLVVGGEPSRPFWQFALPSYPQGRFVRIKNRSGQYLSMSEVQVTGRRVN